MRNLQRRSYWASIIRSPATAFCLVVLVGLLARSLWLTYTKAQLAGELAGGAENELAQVTKRQNQLAADIAALQTDRGVEAVIRSKFPVVKEGEKVITVVSSPATSTATTTSSWWDWLSRK